MPKFKHKPTEIEAIKASDALKFAATEWGKLPKWIRDAYEKGGVLFGSSAIHIQTPNGMQGARPEDWIILGVAGEIYPCPDEVMQKAYDPA